MSSLLFLATELQSLASETRRKYPEVREASDKAVALLRANSEQGTAPFIDGPYTDDLLRPVFMGCSTKNAKVVAISMGSLQRLIALKVVPVRAVPQLIGIMADIIAQGVDIQLRILQVLSSLLTNFSEVHGDLLGDALLICFKLQESRTAVVSSTAAATLRQLVMFIFEKVDNDEEYQEQTGLQTVRLPNNKTASLHPSALDAYRIFEDLCLLANSERSNFLRLESLPKTFALELIESVLTNYHDLFHNRPEILLLLHHHLCPLILKSLSERPHFPLTLRSTRVVFILLKQFSDELSTESEVFSMLLIKIASGEDSNASDGSKRPHWMRILAVEVLRGLCSDSDLMRAYWARYDNAGAGSKVFTSLIAALKRLVTEKPAILGVGQLIQGIGVQGDGSGYGLETVAGIVAGAAATTVSGALGIHSTVAGLATETASMKLQCIDQLDKADPPPIPDGYIYLLGLQCLVAISEGLATFVLPAYSTLCMERLRSREGTVNVAPPAIDLSSLPEEDDSIFQLKSAFGMVESGWPALLAASSFLLGTNLSDELFAEVLGSLQALTNVAGALGLSTPRDAFLTSLSKLSIPARVLTKLDSWVDPVTPRSASVVEGIAALAGANTSTQTPGLSERNIACLKVLISSAIFLAGSLGESWFNVLETLQNADHVLTSKGTRSAAVRRGSTTLSPAVQRSTSLVPPSQQPTPELLTDVEPEHVLAAMQSLFESSKILDDQAFHHFVVALCKLSTEMIGMQVPTEVDNGSVEDLHSAVADSPVTNLAHRRRVSGIQLTRTPRSRDFSVSKLGVVALLNIHRLVYQNADIAWNPITSHFLMVIRHGSAPASLRLQAARMLDENILVVVLRNLSSASPESNAQVQRRTLDALAMQVFTEGTSPTVVDLRRMGLETLHRILQTSAHNLLVGWETILEMLASVCKPGSAPLHPANSASREPLSPIPASPPSPRVVGLTISIPTDKPNTSLIKIAFQSLSLVCDTLSSLSPDQLKLCITTLGLFGRQMDTNIALTAAESLLWGVSDSIQLKRRDSSKEPQYNELWLFLLLELLDLCTDARPEVRGGSIQTLFRTLQLYGSSLSLDTWDECMWKITFPLVDAITTALRSAAAVPSEEAQINIRGANSWDESKILALNSIGAIFNDFLASKIIHLESFQNVWDAFIERIQDAVLLDNKIVSTAALRTLERALKVLKDVEQDYRNAALVACEKTWDTWEGIGSIVGKHAGHGMRGTQTTAVFTQDCLVAFVDVVKVLRRTSRSANRSEWDLDRLKQLVSVLKSLLTYPNSPDFRPDVDGLTPLQSDIMETLEGIDLLVPGSPSLVLTELANYLTLPFLGAFDVEPQSVQPLDNKKGIARVTYVGLCKKVMPKLASLSLRFKDSIEVYGDGTIEAIFTAFSIPIKLKYECPPASRFSSDPPLFKSAATNVLTILKACAPKTLVKGIPLERVTGIWKRIINVIDGALLADCSPASAFPLDVQDSEETFDHAWIVSIEEDVLPYLGDEKVSDDIIVELGKTLQYSSNLNLLDVDQRASKPYDDDTKTLVNGAENSSKSINQFAEIDVKSILGSTVPATPLPRERFSYWCLDLLFLLCSDATDDKSDQRKRTAALCLPSLLARTKRALVSYVRDEAISGDIPSSRSREVELLYILQKLCSLQLYAGSLWAALSNSPTKFATNLPAMEISKEGTVDSRNLSYRSKRAHLFYLYSVIVEIASMKKRSPSAWVPQSASIISSSKVTLSVNASPAVIHLDARQLAHDCLKLIGQEIGLPI